MKLKNQNILIVSNESWGPVWYSKHNYAWQLSKKNKVYFLNPAEKFSLLNIFKKNIIAESINSNLISITYKNILPVKYNFLRLINEWFIYKKLNYYFASEKATKLLFWTFDPIRLSSPERLNPLKIILHAVDHYLFTYPSEPLLAKKADIVICVSDIIAIDYRMYNSNVHVIPHAIPDDEFLPVKKERSEKIIGIFAGTIDERLDYSYINYIAKAFPDITFKFLGTIKPHVSTFFNQSAPNIIYDGIVPSSELKKHIHDADFCFLFKDFHHPGNNISSHKMLQYFAQGKPIFSTELSQYEKNRELLFMENNKEKMAMILKNFIEKGDKNEFIEKRVEYAKQHTFSSALQNIEKILN